MPKNKYYGFNPEKLLEAIFGMDEEAWKILQLIIQDIVRKLRLSLKGQTTEDIVQIILFHILKKIKDGGFNPSNRRNYYSYLVTIARNCIVDESRKIEYRTILKSISLFFNDSDSKDGTKELQIPDPSAPVIEDQIYKNEIMKYLFECVEFETPEKRRLFKLRMKKEERGLTDSERMELLSINNATVEYFRIKERLIKCIQLKLQN